MRVSYLLNYICNNSSQIRFHSEVLVVRNSICMCVYLAAAAAKSLQSCPTLCDPIDGSPPGSPVPGILQARTLQWILLQCMKVKSESEVSQLCLTLRNPMDCSLPGSSVHGIFQAREPWFTPIPTVHYISYCLT